MRILLLLLTSLWYLHASSTVEFSSNWTQSTKVPVPSAARIGQATDTGWQHLCTKASSNTTLDVRWQGMLQQHRENYNHIHLYACLVRKNTTRFCQQPANRALGKWGFVKECRTSNMRGRKMMWVVGPALGSKQTEVVLDRYWWFDVPFLFARLSLAQTSLRTYGKNGH